MKSLVKMVLALLAAMAMYSSSAFAQSCAAGSEPGNETTYFTGKIAKVEQSDRGKNVTVIGHGWKIVFLAKQGSEYAVRHKVSVALVRDQEGIFHNCFNLAHDDVNRKQTSLLKINGEEVEIVWAEDLHKRKTPAYRPPDKPSKHVFKAVL